MVPHLTKIVLLWNYMVQFLYHQHTYKSGFTWPINIPNPHHANVHGLGH